MTFLPEIVVLCGGLSSEREVSLRSGNAVASVLPGARLVELESGVRRLGLLGEPSDRRFSPLLPSAKALSIGPPGSTSSG